MAILWICGSRFLPRDPKKHDHSSGITGSVGTIIIYHEWPDMLQYMDKNVKIYHISGNIILFRNSLATLSIYLLSGTLSRLYQYIYSPEWSRESVSKYHAPERSRESVNIFTLRNSLVNLSEYSGLDVPDV